MTCYFSFQDPNIHKLSIMWSVPLSSCSFGWAHLTLVSLVLTWLSLCCVESGLSSPSDPASSGCSSRAGIEGRGRGLTPYGWPKPRSLPRGDEKAHSWSQLREGIRERKQDKNVQAQTISVFGKGTQNFQHYDLLNFCSVYLMHLPITNTHCFWKNTGNSQDRIRMNKNGLVLHFSRS